MMAFDFNATPAVDGAAERAMLIADGRLVEGGTLERLALPVGVPLDHIGIASAARAIYRSLDVALPAVIEQADRRVAAAIRGIIAADRLAAERRKKLPAARAAESTVRK